ncbi:MAG: TIGR00159 family protein [Sandaracinus sp.]|nr:TIGR00159 family protein [Sandaracinus sp.]|tara:strand:+ start:12 stop:944 length:933 start_codon:yes stop_codon:yes gene_type:complete
MDLLMSLLGDGYDAVAGFFGRGGWEVVRDCVDIGLVAILIYWGLVILKGTRAMQMAFGLVLVFVGYLVARRLGFFTIWSILESLVTYAVLVIVVIFQADIRRALMRVGRGPLFRGQRTARETTLIEEVIKAAQTLAQKRIGGLVVFERGAELDEFIDKGTVLDAEVTKELLYTIFIPSFENPMHDGALIIRDGRVWQAGAVLPLAGSAGRDRTLGTRHRAALGITEETDAVVIVVSEERGAVSLCFHGNIVRNLDGPSLRDALFGLFYRQERKKKKSKAKKSKSMEGRTSLVPDEVDASLTGAKAEESSS